MIVWPPSNRLVLLYKNRNSCDSVNSDLPCENEDNLFVSITYPPPPPPPPPPLSVRLASSFLGPHGDGLLVAGLFFTDYPPSWEKIPLLRTRGYVILRGHRGGSVGSAFDSGPMCCRFESHLWN